MNPNPIRAFVRAACALALAAIVTPPLAADEPSIAPLPKPAPLAKPSAKRGPSVMEALAARASVREWDTRDLSAQDLADLLWAANGVNRPASGKRTAPSAMNSQDVDVYVFTKEGAFLYDAARHALTPVSSGDRRADVTARPGGPPPSAGAEAPPPPPPAPVPPVLLVLVSDAARFTRGGPELKAEWAAFDSGIVSQNVSLFCASAGLATVPRAGMNKPLVREVLRLRETQLPMLNHPVGYPVKR